MTTWPREPEHRQIAANIRMRLSDLRLSQEQLAKRLQVSRAWVSRRLGGDTRPTPLEILAMGGALGMSSQQLYAQTTAAHPTN